MPRRARRGRASRLSSSTARAAERAARPPRRPRPPRARPGRAGRAGQPAARGWWAARDARTARARRRRPTRPSRVTLVHEHAHELLDEQRVALGAGEDPLGEVGGHAGVADQVLDQRPALGAAERLELDPRGGGHLAAEVGPACRAGRSGRRRRSAPGSARDRAREVLDQVEEGGLGPVDVLEDDDQRPLGARPPRAACAPPRRSPSGRRRRPTARARRPRARRSWPCRRRPAAARAILACASSGCRRSSVPASSATTSRSGQNVSPSP